MNKKINNRKGSAKSLIVILSCIILLTFAITFDCIRVYGTKDIVTITVTDKAVKRYNNNDRYIIYTNEETFELTDELFAAKFNSSDDYGKIQIGKTYKFVVCGWRVPWLSWYRNIIKINEVIN